jgi:hypothetical protein
MARQDPVRRVPSPELGLRAADAGPSAAAAAAGSEPPGIASHGVKNDVTIVWELTFVRLDGIKYNAKELTRCVRTVLLRVCVIFVPA